jgi:ABC-2 type transport system permease protein
VTTAVFGPGTPAPPPAGSATPESHRRQSGRAWRSARVTMLSELNQWGRVTSALFMMVARGALTYWLWSALYKTTDTSAGLNRSQATTYAMLGVFYMSFRTVNRWAARDTMTQHMTEGTIAYWFLRPVSPRRYYCIRQVGDLVYGGCWALLAVAVCAPFGLICAPTSPAAGLASGISLLLGLVILYYLQQLIDLACFWSTVNYQLVVMFGIVQNILAGALIPLWFFPGWFVSADRWLPFQSTLNVPISLYLGLLPLSGAVGQLALQAGWIALLAALTTLVWRRAGARVTVLGG